MIFHDEDAKRDPVSVTWEGEDVRVISWKDSVWLFTNDEELLYIRTQEEIDEFITVLHAAWAEHLRLKAEAETNGD